MTNMLFPRFNSPEHAHSDH